MLIRHYVYRLCDSRKAGRTVSYNPATYDGDYKIEIDSSEDNGYKYVALVTLSRVAASSELIRELGVEDGSAYTNQDILISPDNGTDNSGDTKGVNWSVSYYKAGNGQKWIATSVDAVCPSVESGAYNFE